MESNGPLDWAPIDIETGWEIPSDALLRAVWDGLPQGQSGFARGGGGVAKGS